LLCAFVLLSLAPFSSARNAGTLVVPRANHTATLLADGRVLLAGGHVAAQGGGATVTATCEIYNPATNSWSPTGALHEARTTHGSVRLPDGRVLVIGGSNLEKGPLASAEIYDPATGAWTSTTSMNTARSGVFKLPVLLLPNGKVLVIGGERNAQTCELYDPVTATWTYTGSLVERRFEFQASLLPNGTVLVAGGEDTKHAIPASEIYDPATGRWSLSGALHTPRVYHEQTVLADGRVLIAGGFPGGSDLTVLSSSETYDPATGQWTVVGDMRSPRTEFSLNLLGDGNVFAAAGTSAFPSTGIATTEEFSATSNRWHLLPQMLMTPRVLHTGTTLLDGSVLIAGGYVTGFGDFVPNAEIFTNLR
jgi:N-acetylneuraminic acid mutarotase